MWRVVWSDEALDQLDEITRYVRGFSPMAAARLEMRIVAVADSLELMPRRGAAIGNERREIAAVRPYIIRYVVLPDEVRILTIRHSARRRQP
jgi:plasmid stabilization system protein ParE